jgi:hypothetical protein
MRYLRGVLLAILLVSVSVALPPSTTAGAAQAHSEKKEITVWVNTKSGVYHCPGSRWYGATKEGKYMTECEAQKAGYRAAYGKPCGSDCK